MCTAPRLPARPLAVLLLCIVPGLAAPVALAAPDGHDEAALEVLRLIGIDSGVRPMTGRMREATLARILTLVPEDADREVVEPYLERIGAVIEGALTWETLRDDFVDAYTAKFTEAELEELVRFFGSPVGTKYLANVTDLNRTAMEIVRENATAAAPEIREITDELLAATGAEPPSP